MPPSDATATFCRHLNRSFARYLIAAVLLSGGLLASPPSMAQTEAEKLAAKHFDRGVRLAHDQQLEAALVEFQRAYDLTQSYEVLYNIGQLLVSLGRPVEAVDVYQRYLTAGGKKVPTRRANQVKKEIEVQQARIAVLDIHVSPEGALIQVDGKDVGKAPLSDPVRVSVGKHVVTASAERYNSAAATVTVAGEDQQPVNLVLERIPEPGPTLPPASFPPSPAVVEPSPATISASGPQKRWNGLKIGGIAVAGAGAVSLAVGTACLIVSNGKHDEGLDFWNQGDIPSANARQDDAKSYMTAANIGFIAGGALLATGATLFVLSMRRPHTTDSALHARIAPLMGHGIAGVSAGGAW